MRTRAARFWMAIALAAMVAVGASGTSPAARAVLRDLSRTAAVPAQAAAAAGLSGLSHIAQAHNRAPAADGVLAPAALLAVVLIAWTFLRRERALRPPVPGVAHARAPPLSRQ
jgi:hypothetical protein